MAWPRMKISPNKNSIKFREPKEYIFCLISTLIKWVTCTQFSYFRRYIKASTNEITWPRIKMGLYENSIMFRKPKDNIFFVINTLILWLTCTLFSDFRLFFKAGNNALLKSWKLDFLSIITRIAGGTI